MNGTEQSDSPIVPRKLANKAARAVAEPTEGSGGTKRNAELQSTVRTQSRAAVSQAQGRIREARYQEQEGTPHGAPAPCRHRLPALGRMTSRKLTDTAVHLGGVEATAR